MELMDEQDRREIFEQFERVHGTEMARKLMAFVPMVPWTELATKADLAGLAEELAAKADLAALAEELATKADLAALAGETTTECERVDHRFERVDDRSERVDEHLTHLQERVLAELGATEQRVLAVFRGELVQAVTTQSRTMVLTMLGAVLTFGGLLLATMRMA